MFKVPVILCALVAVASCCVLPQFDVLVSKGANVNLISYSKEGIKDYDTVSVQYENITVLCSGIFSGLNLVSIKIFESNIKHIEPGAFRNMPNLLFTYLADNKIESVEDGTFDNDNLEWINLNGNSITKISPNAFSKIPILNRISLDDNKLNYVDVNWFKNNLNLEIITLTRNEIAHIPAGFLKYKLTYEKDLRVYLGMNPIQTIADGAFDNIDKLSLTLDETKLKKVTNMFKDVNQLDKLYIDFNRVECYSQEELDIMKIAKKVTVRKKYLPKGCLESFQVWGKKNNVLIEETLIPRWKKN